MELTIEQVERPVAVTILTLVGKLDASNYESVIAQGQALYGAGTRRVLVDLTGLSFMGSSGLVALHSLTLMLSGGAPPNPEVGWSAIRSMADRQSGGPQPYVKLLNPQPKIEQMLTVTGLNDYYAIFTDREAALASFA